ncbi:MAG: 2'-5' RNA ligase family protein [Saprospiraceae bacterium]
MLSELYFIAIIPPAELQAEVTAFKQYAAQHFGSSHALKSPPHITLIPPFRWPDDRLAQLNYALANHSIQAERFSIDLQHFSSFPPSVIYVNISPNEHLNSFQNQLKKHLATTLGLQNESTFGFHPHMTVAFKDLKESHFPDAWAYFSRQQYQRSFQVSSYTLLSHTGQFWQIDQSFDL